MDTQPLPSAPQKPDITLDLKEERSRFECMQQLETYAKDLAEAQGVGWRDNMKFVLTTVYGELMDLLGISDNPEIELEDYVGKIQNFGEIMSEYDTNTYHPTAFCLAAKLYIGGFRSGKFEFAQGSPLLTRMPDYIMSDPDRLALVGWTLKEFTVHDTLLRMLIKEKRPSVLDPDLEESDPTNNTAEKYIR